MRNFHPTAVPLCCLIALLTFTLPATARSYKQGYQLGFKHGLSDGYEDAYKKSYQAGRNDPRVRSGKKGNEFYAGYGRGYEDGYAKGNRRGDRHGYQDGHRDQLRDNMRDRYQDDHHHDEHDSYAPPPPTEPAEAFLGNTGYVHNAWAGVKIERRGGFSYLRFVNVSKEKINIRQIKLYFRNGKTVDTGRFKAKIHPKKYYDYPLTRAGGLRRIEVYVHHKAKYGLDVYGIR